MQAVTLYSNDTLKNLSSIPHGILISLLLLMPLSLLLGQTIVVNPYLQDVSSNAITLMWESDAVGQGYVDYGISPFDLDQSQTSISVVGSGQSRIHTVLLSSLTPQTKYYYRVRMIDGQESTLRHFVTLAHPSAHTSTQIVAISDMQSDSSHPDKFREIIEEGIIPTISQDIGSELSDLEAVMIPGDLVVTGGTYSQWQEDFFNPSDSLFGYVPFYPVPGNHEYLGNGLSNFKKYMTMPDNGAADLEDECWYKDISNVRIIGLNSNSGNSDQITQLNWLSTVLDLTMNAAHIDFVFAELHHPYKSELWTPGENDFTGKVIDSLQSFTTLSGKPSIHFFGHTHGYSRGQSRDHKHLWVNVATAGGAIDNWGEFPNADYEEFVKSQDEYGFVLLDVDAGIEPKFVLRRYSRGDQDVTLENVTRDELTIYRHEYAPHTPRNIFPIDGDTVQAGCLELKASQFSGVMDTLQGAHWQIATSNNFVDAIVDEKWSQNENFYNEVNLQADDDLTDQEIANLGMDAEYYWRVRYRDQSLEWSQWSTPTTFYYQSQSDTLSPNLIVNQGAENGIASWIGDIESLENAECNSVSPYIGSRNFGVGGICANEMNVGLAYQVIELSQYQAEISLGQALVSYGGYLRNFSGSDVPEVYIEYYDNQGAIISTTEVISSSTDSWTLVENITAVPPETTVCRLYLKGNRNSGSDNDSYFDELRVYLLAGSCSDCNGDSSIDIDGDGFCNDIDCDDNNPDVYPGANEGCDNLDNDCDGVYDLTDTITWTGNGTDTNWGNPDNWDHQIVPLSCQYVVVPPDAVILVEGVFACKGIITGINSMLTIPQGSFLNIDSHEESTIDPACINGLLSVNGKWQVR